MAALALAGCTTASTEDNQTAESKADAPGVTLALEGAPDGGRTADEPAAPAVPEDKQKEAQNLAEKAEKIMLDPALAPREKYPQALVMLRNALELDPSSALAKEGIKLIEDIYKSMGRPVPE